MAELNLGAPAYEGILKVSRTVADLAGSDDISSEHVERGDSVSHLDRILWVCRKTDLWRLGMLNV